MILKAKQYELINNVLFRRIFDSILLICLENSKSDKVLPELHNGPDGGHIGGNMTLEKILHACYYWPTLFKGAHEYARKFKVCQSASRRQRKPAFPLQPVNIEQPFEQ